MDDEHRRPAGRPYVPAALSISEILICVFGELDNASRAAAARVCRTWVDVALDVLWEELESPLPIMRLLGPFGWFIGGWDWKTGFPEGDWAHFESYTRRVRSFSFDRGMYMRTGLTANGSDVLAKLVHYVTNNHGTFLLPRIQRLRWDVVADNDLQAISPFLSPTLTKVDIELQWKVSPSATYRLLRTLHAVLSHEVVSFRLVPYRWVGDEFDSELTSTISIQSNLRVLRIPAFSMKISMLVPNLRVLEAKFDPAWNSDPGALFLQLSDKCPLIEDLRIIFPSNSTLTVESIRPLLRYSKLRRLDLEYRGAVDMQDKHIEEMGSAWRDMEALHIAARRAHVDPVRRPSGTPIASLVTFVQAFSPKLRKLAIHLNNSDVPYPPDPPIRFANLEFFSVGTSQLVYSGPEHRRVVRFLNAVLPVWMNSIHSEDSSYDPSWSIYNFEPLEDGRLSANAGWDMLSKMLSDCRKASSDDA